ncbi:hypothetical protein [Aestuariivirga sp.]|uniref:hypothetical protein n=1 Tax=Aestuariivirga sp. TaxID=2650926 RepID=UPI0035939A32
MKKAIKISPLLRLNFAFRTALMRDSKGILFSLREKYIQQLQIREEKRNKVFRGVFILDAVLAFSIAGKNFTLPLVGVASTDIPAIVEIVTLASAVAVIIFANEFLNWAAYQMLASHYGGVAAEQVSSDPDFYNAAEHEGFFTLKMLRTKMNIFQPDDNEPGMLFTIYSKVVYGLLIMLFILFPILHFLLTGFSLSLTYMAHGLSIFTAVYFLIVVALNLLSVLMWVGCYRGFTFYIETPDQPEGART